MGSTAPFSSPSSPSTPSAGTMRFQKGRSACHCCMLALYGKVTENRLDDLARQPQNSTNTKVTAFQIHASAQFRRRMLARLGRYDEDQETFQCLAEPAISSLLPSWWGETRCTNTTNDRPCSWYSTSLYREHGAPPVYVAFRYCSNIP